MLPTLLLELTGMNGGATHASWLPGRDSAVHQAVRWDIDVAIQAIHDAFAPWGCIVHVYGFAKRLRCKIVDFSGKPILDDFFLSALDMVEPHRFGEAIQLMRASIEKKGFAVQPWQFNGGQPSDRH